MKYRDLAISAIFLMLGFLSLINSNQTDDINNLQEQLDNQYTNEELDESLEEIEWHYDRLENQTEEMFRALEEHLDIVFDNVYEEIDNNQLTQEEKQLYFTIAVLDIQIYMMQQDGLTEEQQIYYDVLVSLREQYESEVE